MAPTSLKSIACKNLWNNESRDLYWSHWRRIIAVAAGKKLKKLAVADLALLDDGIEFGPNLKEFAWEPFDAPGGEVSLANYNLPQTLGTLVVRVRDFEARFPQFSESPFKCFPNVERLMLAPCPGTADLPPSHDLFGLLG